MLVCLCAGAILAAGCSSSGDQRADAANASFADSTASHSAAGSRSVLSLDELSSQPSSEPPVVVLADVVEVRPDRGWVNLPESEIKDRIDVREVPFDSSEPQFRTILVTLDVESTLRAGGGLEAATQRAIDAGGQVQMTLVLYPDTSFDAARSELLALGDVVVPLDEDDRGAWGIVLHPYGGYDIVLDVHDDGTLGMPLTDAETATYVVGDLTTLDALRDALSA